MSPSTEGDLERWIVAFRGPLVGLFASWGADWRSAEELAQEVFAEAWLGRGRFRADAGDVEAVGAWLRGIAIRLSWAAQRKNEARPGVLLDEHAAPEPHSEDQDERRTQLVSAFGELSPQHQTVLRMHYLEETSTREVAALLGLTPKAVEDRLYQARIDLRARVDRAARRAAQGVRP